jgi:hypothetical protein
MSAWRQAGSITSADEQRPGYPACFAAVTGGVGVLDPHVEADVDLFAVVAACEGTPLVLRGRADQPDL